MDTIIKKEVDDGPHNLVDLFSETELANTLFDAGIMCLTWGISPWTYYVYSVASQNEIEALPLRDCRVASGSYRLANDIMQMSIVPGHELMNWPSAVDKRWPTVEVAGTGETLNLDLHVRRFNPIGSSAGPALAMFNIYRNNNLLEASPLLNVNLEEFN